jgi:methionyl aminopeptidase
MNEHVLSCLRKAGSIAREARELGTRLVDDGVRYLDVAQEIESCIVRNGANPAFPVNIGVNDIAAHFTPNYGDDLKFVRGDVVKIDVGAHVEGYIGDTAATVEVGTKNWQRLIEASEAALRIALDMAGDGVSANIVGGAIERSIKESGFRPIVNLTGHDMNQYNLHAGLTVPNIDDGVKLKMRQGMAVAIEPFATNGSGSVSNEQPGNIYRVLKERPMRDKKALEFFHQIEVSFGTLPFCERWCVDLNREAPALLHTLLRHGLISSYPQLREIKRGIVSQAEHTVIVMGTKCEVTT